MAAQEPSALRIARVRHLAASGQAHQIRLDARLSRPELAASVGVTDQSIMGWELGRRVPSGPHALVYLDLLDALVEFGGSGAPRG